MLNPFIEQMANYYKKMKYSLKKTGFIIVALLAFAGFAFNLNNKGGSSSASLKIYKDLQVTGFFNRETGWIASDGAYSFPLGNGKVLWTFGDSFTNDYDAKTGTVPCLFNVRSAAMLQPLNSWDWHQTTTILNPQKSTLFHSDTTANHFNWPGTGFAVKDTAYVYCYNMKNVSTGMGFENGGDCAFAKIKIPEMTVVGYHILQNFNGIEFGIGFEKSTADGFVYAFGNKGLSFGNNRAYLARFPIDNPNAGWTFWDGKGWNKDVKAAHAIGENHQAGVTVSKVKNKYVMLSTAFSVGCDQGKSIYVQVSDKRTGPFTKEKLLYTLDDTLNGHYPFFYLAAAHPEFINDKDELLITYCINGYGTCVKTCVNNRFNPNYYRPRGIRVPLKLIDPTYK